VFGPVMICWFTLIGGLGLIEVIKDPSVIKALLPTYALHTLTSNGIHGFLLLGSIILAVTGAEALYADMGHFGRRPIQVAWLWIVFPALVLNYFGQGALILADPAAVSSPFYRMVPGWALFPVIILATAATVIASQAVISGAFSLARQAVQLGYLPRLRVLHTSEDAAGQVYLPWVNRALLYVVVGLVLAFGSSDALAAAYGVSVTGTMIITTILMLVVAARRWHPPRAALWAMGVGFLAIDGAFFGATLVKVADGGWFPLVLATMIFIAMRTWRRGRELLREASRREQRSIGHFLRSIAVQPPLRVPGTAVFMTASNDSIPLALLHNLKHNRILHDRIILLTVVTTQTPRAESEERVAVDALEAGFHRVTLRFGFMEDPFVPRALAGCRAHGLDVEPSEVTYFASRETVVATARRGMPMWRDALFALMLRNTVTATSFFGIPGNQLVELGTQVEI
jgi:KUP system potassium uptake protein